MVLSLPVLRQDLDPTATATVMFAPGSVDLPADQLHGVVAGLTTRTVTEMAAMAPVGVVAILPRGQGTVIATTTVETTIVVGTAIMETKPQTTMDRQQELTLLLGTSPPPLLRLLRLAFRLPPLLVLAPAVALPVPLVLLVMAAILATLAATAHLPKWVGWEHPQVSPLLPLVLVSPQPRRLLLGLTLSSSSIRAPRHPLLQEMRHHLHLPVISLHHLLLPQAPRLVHVY